MSPTDGSPNACRCGSRARAADVERRLHRTARDAVRLDEQELNDKRDRECRDDDRHETRTTGCVSSRALRVSLAWATGATVDGSARGRIASADVSWAPPPCLQWEGHGSRPREAPARLAARLLRRRRPGGADGRARARPARRARLRAQGDRPQQARRRAAALRAARSSSIEETEVPEGSTVVFSAHGVAPSVHANAAARGLRDDRRDLPARHEGARRGEESSPPRATRSC